MTGCPRTGTCASGDYDDCPYWFVPTTACCQAQRAPGVMCLCVKQATATDLTQTGKQHRYLCSTHLHTGQLPDDGIVLSHFGGPEGQHDSHQGRKALWNLWQGNIIQWQAGRQDGQQARGVYMRTHRAGWAVAMCVACMSDIVCPCMPEGCLCARTLLLTE
jgi:hypothetical protein